MVKINDGAISYRDWWYRHMEEPPEDVKYASASDTEQPEPEIA